MNKELRELIRAEETTQIPILPKDPHFRAFVICQHLKRAWNVFLTKAILQEESMERGEMSKEQNEERRQMTAAKMKRISDLADGPVFTMAKKLVVLQDPWLQRYEIDDDFKFKYQGGLKNVCPAESKKISLKGCVREPLLNYATELIARESTEPNQIELHKLLTVDNDPVILRCNMEHVCLGKLSNLGGVRCFQIPLKVITK
jgi:hypothetical protein